MKKLKSLLGLALILVMLPALAQKNKPFEGVITFTTSVTGPMAEMVKGQMPSSMTYSFKGDKSYVAIKGGPMATDVLNQGDKAFMLMHEKKTAYDLTKENAEKPNVKVTPTDTYETVAGYKCRKYVIEMNDENSGMTITSNVWATKDIAITAPKFDASQIFTKGVEGMPLRVNTSVQMFEIGYEAQKVEKVKVKDDLFKVPAGYTVKPFDQAEFQEQMKERAGGAE